MKRTAYALVATAILVAILWFAATSSIRAADDCKSRTFPMHDLPYGTPTTPICRPLFFAGEPLEEPAFDMVSVIRLSPIPTGKPPEPPPQRTITREPVRRPRLDIPDVPPGPDDVKPPVMPRDPMLPKVESASRVHLLVLADNEAKDAGKTHAAGANLFEQLLKSGIRKERLGEVVKLTSPELDGDAIAKRLADLPVNSDDALVVYYAGAAEFDENNSSYVLTPSKAAKKLPREDLKRAIAAKKARFSVFLSDPAAHPAVAEPQGKPQTPAPGAAALESLFFSFRGIVDVHAATDGEFAAARGNYGGMFTLAFVREFSRPAGIWADLIEGVKFTTNNTFKSYRLEVLKSEDVPAPAKALYRNQESQVPVILTPLDNIVPVKSGTAIPPVELHILPVSIPVQLKTAIIGVRLPEKARLSIDGQPTDITGVERRFRTPAFATNAAQSIELRVDVNNWTGIYRVNVTGGQTVLVDLQVPGEVMTAGGR